jgi:osmotically inducible lipoprotein OsmB
MGACARVYFNHAREKSMNKSLAAGAIAAASLALGGCATNPTHAQVGTGVGAVVGGVVGSALTGGSTAGTVAGAAAGALIGNEVGRRVK